MHLTDSYIVNTLKSDIVELEVSEAKRLKQLEEENRRLKKAVADLTLDNQILKEINSKKW